MPKVQIEVPDEAYKKLKAQAADDDRSLTKYLIRGLIYLSNIPNGYHNNQIERREKNAKNSNRFTR